MIRPKRIVSIQFNFYFTHTKYALNKLNTNTYVEEKKNYKDSERKKDERECFAKSIMRGAGQQEGPKKELRSFAYAVLCYGQKKNPRLGQTIPSL